MLDDCLPVNAEMTERLPKPESRKDAELAAWWTGDVWKLIPILKKYRPDLRVICVDTRPTGTVCVTRLDPGSKVLTERFFEIVDDFVNQEINDANFAAFYASIKMISGFDIMADFSASKWLGA
jgi:hypothetical protein